MPVSRATLESAIAEAREFITRAEAVLPSFRRIEAVTGRVFEAIDPSRATGALRRQSMELSQALVAIRRREP